MSGQTGPAPMALSVVNLWIYTSILSLSSRVIIGQSMGNNNLIPVKACPSLASYFLLGGAESWTL